MRTHISFIIPTPPGGKPVRCLDSLMNLRYPHESIEVLVVEGRSPPSQRNLAAKKAQGSILYFIDDDVVVEPDIITGILAHFDKGDVAIVGGPCLTPECEPIIARSCSHALASFIGAGPMRYRYKSIGGPREADETNLIMCNVSCKRDVYLEEGGLRQDLFPNEENEFFNRLAKKGYKLVYNPEVRVYHPVAPTYARISRKIFGYGVGRVEQIFVQPSCFRLLFVLPTAFVIYILSLLIFSAYMTPFHLLPLILYVITTGLESIKVAVRLKEPRVFPTMWLSYPVIHLSYGLGFAFGFLKLLVGRYGKNSDSEVFIRKASILASDAPRSGDR